MRLDHPVYKAFISYSHAVDGKLAPALQSALHRFARPWHRMRRATRVFRDDTNLSVSPSLWTSIEAALGQSEYFLLLASPQAAASKWVRKEVDFWLKNRTPEKLLIVLTEGEIAWDPGMGDFDWEKTTALPRNLCRIFAEEPLYLDLRWSRTTEDVSLENPRFRDQIAALAATLHNRPKDELIGEDVRQRRNALRAAWGAAALLTIFALAVLVAAYVAITQKEEALRQATIATARALSARAELLRTTRVDEIETSALLAAQSLLRKASPEATYTARYAIDLLPTVVAKIAAPAPVEALDICEESGFAAFVGSGGTIAVISLSRGEMVFRYELKQQAKSNDMVFYADPKIKLGPSGSCVAIQERGSLRKAFDRPDGSDGTIRLFSVTHRREIKSLRPVIPVTDFRFSPDGDYILVFYDKGVVESYRTENGALHQKLPHGDLVLDAVFSNDRDYLVTAGMDKNVTIWSWPSGRPLRKIPHLDAVSCVQFSPDGSTLATAVGKVEGIQTIVVGGDGLEHEPLRAEELEAARHPPYGVMLYDFADELSTIPSKPITPLKLDGYASSIRFSPGGRYLIAITLDGSIRVWDRNSDLSHRDLHLSRKEPVFSPNMAAVVYPLTSGSVQLSPIMEGVEGFTMETPAPGLEAEPVEVMAFLPNGRHLLTQRGFGQVFQIWDILQGAEVARIIGGRGHDARLSIAAYSGRMVLARNHEVLVLGASGRQDDKELAHPFGIRAATIDPARGRILSVGWDHRLLVSDRDGKPQSELKLEYPIVALSEIDDSSLVVLALDGTQKAPEDSGQTDRQIEDVRRKTLLNFRELAYEAAPREATAVLRVLTTEGETSTVSEFTHDCRVVDLALSRDGAWLATAGPDGAVLWAVATGTPTNRFVQDEKAFRVAFDRAAQRLAIRTKSRSLVWDVQQSRELVQVNSPETVLDVAISADGRLLACGRSPTMFEIVDIGTGTTMQRFSHAEPIDELQFSPSGDALLAVDRKGEILVWGTATGELLATFDRGHVVRAVGFGAEGRTVDIVLRDGSVLRRLWRPQDLISEIDRRVTRSLTADEWARVSGGIPFLPLVEQSAKR